MRTILALNGSLRAASSNHVVLTHLQALATPLVRIVSGAALDALPHFNPDLDTQTPPEAVAAFRTQIATTDALLICTPEYTFSIPGSLKNALDWLVSAGSLYQKRVGVVATSTSKGEKVLAALGDVLAAHQAKLIASAALHPADVRTDLSGDAAAHSATGQALQRVLAALEA